MKLVKFATIMALAMVMMLACSSKLSEEEYYNAAKNSYAKENYEVALDNFKKIVEYYPQGQKAAEASFMLGFINANDLKNLEEAEKYYKEFIKKHPDHELADDAQYELNTLGQDINDLPMFQNIAADSTAN